jgi:hypothetical protein
MTVDLSLEGLGLRMLPSIGLSKAQMGLNAIDLV